MIDARRKIGRCANGAERDKGIIYHAINGGDWVAMCGTRPGRQSAGWQSDPEPVERVNCQRCLKKLHKVPMSRPADVENALVLARQLERELAHEAATPIGFVADSNYGIATLICESNTKLQVGLPLYAAVERMNAAPKTTDGAISDSAEKIKEPRRRAR